MPSVYDPENFQGRVNLAALYITEGREPSRAFDTCFEMDDGAAVGLALMRRAAKAPEGKLARNLWRYLGREHAEANAAENGHRTNLAGWARELRTAQAQPAAIAATVARVFDQPAPYAEELTPTGQQFVIPGCERSTKPNKPGPHQLSLFA